MKKYLFFAIGSHTDRASDFFETANLLNDQPIGRHPSHLNDRFYLSPKSLLLGRSMNQPVPLHLTNDQKMSQYSLVESTLNMFWKKRQQSFLQQMAYYKKWKIQHSSIQPGDVVILEDQNALHGLWKLEIVKNVNPGRDTLIKNVEVEGVRKDGSKHCCLGPPETGTNCTPKNEQFIFMND